MATRVSKWAATRRRLPRVAAGLVLLLSTGCALAPAARDVEPFRRPRPATPDEVLAAWDDYCQGIQTLDASGDLSLRDARAGRSGQLSVRVVAARGDRLYLKGSVAVVTGVEVTSDGERFWFSVPSKKKIWTGLNGVERQPEDAGEEGRPYYALRPTDVTGALLPEPLAPQPGQALVFSGERDRFLLTLARSEGDRGLALRRVWLDRESLRPLRAQRFDAQGDLLTDVSWRDWKDGLPRDVTILRPLDGYIARFLLNRVEVGREIPERAFTGRTPDGYEVIEVRD